MSTEPLPGPDPYDDPPPRARWLVPAMIGLSIGVLFGGAGIFSIMSIASRSRSTELAVEKFNVQNVLNGVPGGQDLNPGENTTQSLGPMGSRANSGSAVHRRITLQGGIPPTTDPGTLGNALKGQIEAEMGRHGAFMSGGGSSGSSGLNEYQLDWESGYYTRDGRRGHITGAIDIRQGRVRVLIIICEGR